MKVTGVMIYYYYICKKKLWYFCKNLHMEQNSELVGLGKLIDSYTYDKNKKSIMIDETINIDFLVDWKVIHEVKKSNKLDFASEWQLKYYIMILKGKGVIIEKGVLDYPKLRKRQDVYLTKEDEKELKKTMEEIEKIVKSPLPPESINEKFCKKCSYYDMCYI